MKKLNVFLTAGFGVLLSLSTAVSQASGGNGSGNEPPAQNRTTGSGEHKSFCDYLPWFCIIAESGGNGSGNEPPAKD